MEEDRHMPIIPSEEVNFLYLHGDHNSEPLTPFLSCTIELFLCIGKKYINLYVSEVIGVRVAYLLLHCSGMQIILASCVIRTCSERKQL